MDKALVIKGREASLISAEEYGRRYPYRPKLYCPYCRQPLFFANGKTQVPHFRHERNNSQAKQCELYASAGMSGVAQCIRMPPPLFIRQKVGMTGAFVIELGLKHPQDSLLDSLVRENAVLKVTNGHWKPKEYKVTAECMSQGMFRIPLRLGQGFSFPNDVRLTHSAKEFAEVWGLPEPINKTVLFSCDRQSLSGRRIETPGCIAIKESMLIVSKLEKGHLASFFPDIEQVGKAETYGPEPLNVFLVTIDDSAIGFLREHNIELTTRDDTPELLWPPALTSSGETRPLFSRSDCLFRVKSSNDDPETKGALYVHTNTSTLNLPLERTYNKQWMSAYVRLSSCVSFISAREWGSTLAILLKCKENPEPGRLSDSERFPVIKHMELGGLEVSALSPCEVTRLYKGGHIERFGLEPGAVQVISNESRELVRIVLDAVLGIHGKRIVFELVPDVVEVVDACQESQQLKQPVGLGRDMAFARSRAVSIHSIDAARDLWFAAMRKA